MTATHLQTGRDKALHDPLTSSGGMHQASRLRRGVAEFLRIPLYLTVVFCALGVAVSLLDAWALPEAPLRATAGAVVPDGGAVEFISAVATSVVTITSITFSVLLIAVQQTATSLTAVVFDQFLRRRSNQVYFGFFIGLSAFLFVILGMARQDPAPVYGAALTLVLTVVALVVLLLLIHGTIDQMRPQAVVRSIHELALRARERELAMLGRTRPERHSEPGGNERNVTVEDSGYVVSLDIDRLAHVAASLGPDTEVLVVGRLGEYVCFGDPVATVVGVDPSDDSLDTEVRLAFGLDDLRKVEVECGYATEQLENIAWASSSSAQQSPQTAVTAVRALRDLCVRWLAGGERDRSERAERPDELPVVYTDGATPRILGALATVIVATAESRQAQTCSELVRAFAAIASRLRSDSDRAAFDRALDSVLPAVIQHAEVPVLADALHNLQQVLHTCDFEASRTAAVRDLLTKATVQLLPKGSDEPEAAHPA